MLSDLRSSRNVQGRQDVTEAATDQPRTQFPPCSRDSSVGCLQVASAMWLTLQVAYCNRATKTGASTSFDTAHGDARLSHLCILESCRWARGRQTNAGVTSTHVQLRGGAQLVEVTDAADDLPSKATAHSIALVPSTMPACCYHAGIQMHIIGAAASFCNQREAPSSAAPAM
jgi:hypothetical protein